ncbi:DUF4249 domain-containing protein [Cesiribacter sp. SM1]|uniref:DUF4249 domain-containing protein n=1 Tax=Cesiribacter sp. SM1 TaxID=2861196 RepID=UPI001CD483CF|nr:DUF4249 domain-containing protein [Cesiribacter sp. SM1]
MQSIKHLPLTILLGILLLAGCEKVIEVDLNSASPKYVIEAVVTDGQGPQQVRITQTKNFDENNDFEGVGTAQVTIADDAGNSSLLSYTGGGLYETTALAGVPGRTYYLTVNAGEETFTATSAMPEPVALDSLYIEEFTTFGDPVKIPYISYNDPPVIRNYYRYLLYVNNVRAKSIYINTDDRNNGSPVERPLPYFEGGDEDRLKAGDIITVEMQSIEQAVYDYFFSLDQTIEQDAATPANPVSNITGGALGYFSAHSTQTATLEVE